MLASATPGRENPPLSKTRSWRIGVIQQWFSPSRSFIDHRLRGAEALATEIAAVRKPDPGKAGFHRVVGEATANEWLENRLMLRLVDPTIEFEF